MQIDKKIAILEKRGSEVVSGLTDYGLDGLQIAKALGTTWKQLSKKLYRLNLPKAEFEPLELPEVDGLDKGETYIYHEGVCPTDEQPELQRLFYAIRLQAEMGYITLTQTKKDNIYLYKAQKL